MSSKYLSPLNIPEGKCGEWEVTKKIAQMFKAKGVDIAPRLFLVTYIS